MKFLVAFFVFAVTLCGAFASECPTACTMEYNPQCALGYYDDDFEWGTYGNPCALSVYNCQNPNTKRYALTGVGECINILPTANSAPKCNKMCTMNYLPVCGIGFIDGDYKWNTYGNGCGLGVYNCQNPDKKMYAITGVGDCSEIFPSSSSPVKPTRPLISPRPVPREYTIQPYSVAA